MVLFGITALLLYPLFIASDRLLSECSGSVNEHG